MLNLLNSVGRPHNNNQSVTGGSTPAPDLTSHNFLFASFNVADANNNFTSVSENFTASDVDTANNVIDFGSDINFGAYTTESGSNKGTQGKFTTTGILPAGLNTTDFYILSHVSGTLYEVYPVADENSGGTIKGTNPSDKVLSSQNYATKSNVIDFTDQGAGTHTFSIIPELSNELVDSLNGYKYKMGVTDNNAKREVVTQGNLKYLDSFGTERTFYSSSYDIFGKSEFFLGDGDAERIEIASKLSDKRSVLMTTIIDMQRTINRSVARSHCLAVNVNTSTNKIRSSSALSYALHNFNGINGDKMRFKLYEVGDALPAPLLEDTDYWMGNWSGIDCTVHTSRADALAGINAINLTTQGTGGFMVNFIQKVGGSNRDGFISELQQPDGTDQGIMVLSHADYTEYNFGTFPMDHSAYLHMSGFWWGLDTLKDFSEIDLWYTNDAIAPIRTGGAPLTKGKYWVGGSSNGSQSYLFDTQADALANTNRITFEALGEGSCRMSYADSTKIRMALQSTFGSTQYFYVPTGKHALTLLLDANNPGETTPVVRVYIDDTLQETLVLNGTKQNTRTTTNPTVAPEAMLNAVPFHVPVTGKIYGKAIGASAGEITSADMNAYLTDIKTIYGL